MAKKNKEAPIRKEPVKTAGQVRIVNLTQKTFPVPYRGSDGTTGFLHIRLQTGRHGQDAPVLPQTAIVPAAKLLERKGLIRIEVV